MTSKPKLVVQLNGGLGNQMFQYAAARSLAKRNNMELVLDTWSGFVRDYAYRRHYQLDSFPISMREANFFETAPLWLYRISNKYKKRKLQTIESHFYGNIIKETKLEFLPQVFEYKITRPCWMIGYWQTSRYFQDHERLIRQELMPPPPNEPKFIDLAKSMQNSNSVALCVRLYEESKNPGIHASDGRLKQVDVISEAARKLGENQGDIHFFLFCTHRAPILEHLHLQGKKTTYVTHDDGFKGTIQSLWLLTQCRHYIITNSSFYWWGAWLGAGKNGHVASEVFAASNFVNKDSLLPGWKQF